MTHIRGCSTSLAGRCTDTLIHPDLFKYSKSDGRFFFAVTRNKTDEAHGENTRNHSIALEKGMPCCPGGMQEISLFMEQRISIEVVMLSCMAAEVSYSLSWKRPCDTLREGCKEIKP